MPQEKTRHPSRDREYIDHQIATGHEVVVEGVLYNRSNKNSLPTQAQLDGDEPLPNAKLRGRLQPRQEPTAAEKAAADKAAAAEKAAAEKAAAAQKAAADKAAADKAAGK